ncbi:MAG: hypothetical protein A2010_04440 [Nitrospirae bacterium GWD2_57_9]|nr:MAG: hypothetical protein A2010_04440 [Nitrospirae bacterium GWD2_57_9]
MKNPITKTAWLIFFSGLLLLAGCATAGAPMLEARRFVDILNRYPETREPLRLTKLTAQSFNRTAPAAASPDVLVMVHPGYALFFGSGAKKIKYSEAKYALLTKQFEDEARFIREASATGKILILIVPANYQEESVRPLSYTAYLNAAAAEGGSVYYLFSESVSNGTISMNDLLDLYRFLQGIKAGKILVGGGFIGRCQREFYQQLTGYIGRTSWFIVPEISTISPDDISDAEAKEMLESIERRDYRPVRRFIDRKLDEAPNLLSIPPKKEL